jgi:hypothetical protein
MAAMHGMRVCVAPVHMLAAVHAPLRRHGSNWSFQLLSLSKLELRCTRACSVALYSSVQRLSVLQPEFLTRTGVREHVSICC